MSRSASRKISPPAAWVWRTAAPACVLLVVRRPVWVRALLGVWGLWFTAALSEAPGVHACAVHGTPAAHNAHDSHQSHAGHTAHAATQSTSPSDASHHAANGCT